MNYVVNREIKKKGGQLCIFFVDLSAAFDRINRDKLKEIMQKKDISLQLRDRLNEIYKGKRDMQSG